jgi:hypothetical protein
VRRKNDKRSGKGKNWKNSGYDKKVPTDGIYQIECKLLLKRLFINRANWRRQGN